MYPTLNGSHINDFGQIDKSQRAISLIKRFDIVTTYYPWEAKDYEFNAGVGEKSYANHRNQKPKETASLKIKRVIGLPEETLTIDNRVAGQEKIIITTKEKKNYIYYDKDAYLENVEGIAYDAFGNEIIGECKNLHFERARRDHNKNNPYKDGTSYPNFLSGDEKTTHPGIITLTLGIDRYFVMGDNWSTLRTSSDCYGSSDTHRYDWDRDSKDPDRSYGGIFKENIHGVLLSIDGYYQTVNYITCSYCGFDKNKSEEKGKNCQRCHNSLEGGLIHSGKETVYYPSRKFF